MEIKAGVSSTAQIDFTRFRMPILAVYDRPEDFPDEYVMRVFDGSAPTNIFMTKQNLQDMNADIAKHTSFVFLNRCPSDVASLVGTWL